jgi:hypothetical protein
VFAVRWQQPQSLRSSLGDEHIEEGTRHRMDAVEVNDSVLRGGLGRPLTFGCVVELPLKEWALNDDIALRQADV